MKVLIPIKVYQKLRMYADSVEGEICGMGKVKVLDDQETIRIEDVRIFKQKVSSVEAKLDKRALGPFYDDLIKNGEDPAMWRLHWHSHADMGVSWSGKDNETMNDWDNQMKEDNWFLSLLTNHDGEILIRLDIFAPFRFTKNNVQFDIIFEDDELRDEIEKDVQKNVKNEDVIFQRNVKKEERKPISLGKKILEFCSRGANVEIGFSSGDDDEDDHL
jgi:hypothetical protein